jgi:uncharacterized protein YdcH (DUF465 family)
MNNYAHIEPKLINKRESYKLNIRENNIRENSRNSNLESILEKILNITEEFNNKLDTLDKKVNDKFEELNNKFEELNTKISTVSNNISTNSNNENEDLKELIKQNLSIDKKDVLKALSYRDYRSILILFKLYYKNDKNKYPIRLFKVRKFEYYANKKWNQDLYGNHSMEVLIGNMQDLFIKYNDINSITYDEFILNQDFINQLDNEKFKKDIFKVIADEIKE